VHQKPEKEKISAALLGFSNFNFLVPSGEEATTFYELQFTNQTTWNQTLPGDIRIQMRRDHV
jgi:hypothetical protein